jgi:pyrroline-5-carboxylate reductase
MSKNIIAILGGGNIGTSLAKGLIASGQYTVNEILITEKREPRKEYLKSAGFNVTDNNREAVRQADILFVSVKPQQFGDLVEEIKDSITQKHLLISTVTSVSSKEIEASLGKCAIIRIMPNTALEICESMTCISFSNTSSENEKMVQVMFDKMGRTMLIPEELMDAATVVGACGIAFALRFMRAMSQGGIEIGFNSEMSQLITAQTVKGAARLILETTNHPEKEIDKVTTPQGITISGLNEMEHQGLSSAVIRGLTTSFHKLENMGSKIRK